MKSSEPQTICPICLQKISREQLPLHISLKAFREQKSNLPVEQKIHHLYKINGLHIMKEIKCERCGDVINPQWSNDDHLDRDICEDCQKVIDDEEHEK